MARYRAQKPIWTPTRIPTPAPGELDTERGRQDYEARCAAWENAHAPLTIEREARRDD